MNTREIAQHLFAYGAFLRAERERMDGLRQATGLECFSEGLSALDSRVEEAQAMANELWEMKENIGQQAERFTCRARQQGTAGGNDPADCDWPLCGCDESATKVITSLQESGLLKDWTVKTPSLTGAQLEALKHLIARGSTCPGHNGPNGSTSRVDYRHLRAAASVLAAVIAGQERGLG